MSRCEIFTDCGRNATEVVDGKHACLIHLKEAKKQEAKDEHARSFAVVVSEYGDKFQPSMAARWAYDESNDNPLLGYSAFHALCRGTVNIAQTSETHQTIRCRNCGLRLVAPIEIQTWRDLKEFCERQALQRKLEGQLGASQ